MNFAIGDILKTFEKPIEKKHEEARKKEPIWYVLKKVVPLHADHCDVKEFRQGVLKIATTSGCSFFEMRQFYSEQILNAMRKAGFNVSKIVVNLTAHDTPQTEAIERTKTRLQPETRNTKPQTLTPENVPF
jgi:hypothetical protein